MIDLAIVGGGLSGLALARGAQQAGLDWQLFEARPRFGGRVLGKQGVDLGPSWFWPGHDRMAALTSDLGLHVFEQYALGEALYEDEHQTQRGRGFASMAGAFRIRGGMTALIDALVAELPSDRLHPNMLVEGVSRGAIMADAETTAARFVALAIPPRLAPALVPSLSVSEVAALNDIPGWMAGQAKAIGLYSHPVWRDAGLSGDAVSRLGPMVEIHDASDNDQAALFGFLGVPAQTRDGQAEAVCDAANTQFTRLFGPPDQVILQDWAQEAFTTTRADWDFNGPHPRYGCPQELQQVWSGELMFASTEFAGTQGGFLEGALERAEELLGQMARHSATT